MALDHFGLKTSYVLAENATINDQSSLTETYRHISLLIRVRYFADKQQIFCIKEENEH